MNRLIVNAVLSALLVLGFVGSAHAGGGKVYIPHWKTVSSWRSHVYCTNISDEDILVTVNFFRHDGELIQEAASSAAAGVIRMSDTDETSYYEYTEYAPGEDFKTVTFYIKPHNTVRLMVTENSPNAKRGYGTIEWSGCANGFGMIAAGWSYATSNSAITHSITINGGNPF